MELQHESAVKNRNSFLKVLYWIFGLVFCKGALHWSYAEGLCGGLYKEVFRGEGASMRALKTLNKDWKHFSLVYSL